MFGSETPGGASGRPCKPVRPVTRGEHGACRTDHRLFVAGTATARMSSPCCLDHTTYKTRVQTPTSARTWINVARRISGAIGGHFAVSIDIAGIQSKRTHGRSTMMSPPQVKKLFIVKDDRRQPEVHCSSVQAAGSYVYVAWFGGAKEGADDVKIWLSTSSDGGSSFAPPKVIASEPGVVHYNPVVFLPAPNTTPKRVAVFYKRDIPIPAWKTYVIESEDAGETWTDLRELVPGDTSGGRGPSKNPLLLASNGQWTAGGSVEKISADGKVWWDAFVDIASVPSSPSGQMAPVSEYKWNRSPMIPLPGDRGDPSGSFPGEGVIQPTLWESPSSPGHIHMLLRSSTGQIVQSDSTDFGRTWSEGRKIGVPNNNSGICLARTSGPGPGARLVLACNPVGVDRGARVPLVCLISDDEGQSWKDWCVLEDTPSVLETDPIDETGTATSNGAELEFSYPTVAPIAGSGVLGEERKKDDEGVWVSYTWRRRGIILARITQGHRQSVPQAN